MDLSNNKLCCTSCKDNLIVSQENLFVDSFKLCENCYYTRNKTPKCVSLSRKSHSLYFKDHSFEHLMRFPILKSPPSNVPNYNKTTEKIPGIGNSYIGDRINNIENRTYLFDQDEDEELIGVWINRSSVETEFMYMGCFPIIILGFNQKETELLSNLTNKLLSQVTLLPSLDTNIIEDPGDIIKPKQQLFLIEQYFKCHHLTCPVLDQDDVIDDFMNKKLSKVLLYSICCISYHYILFDPKNAECVFGDLISIDVVKIVNHFEMQARYYLNKCFYKAEIQTVQALILLSGNPANPVTSPKVWLYSGMATRMAMELKLNRTLDKNNNIITTKENELRKLIWWGCFMIDTFYSIILSRPLSIQLNQCDVEYPELTNHKPTNLFIQAIKISVIASKINMLVTSAKLKSSLEDRKDRALDCISLLKSWYSEFLLITKTTSSYSKEKQKHKDGFIQNTYISDIQDMILYNYYYYLLMITELIYICDNSFKITNPEDITKINPYCLKIIKHYSLNLKVNILCTPTKVYSIFYCSVICIYNLKLIFKKHNLYETFTIDSLLFWYKNLASCYCIMLNIQSCNNNSTKLAQSITTKEEFSSTVDANAFVALSLAFGLSELLPLSFEQIPSLKNKEFIKDYMQNRG